MKKILTLAFTLLFILIFSLTTLAGPIPIAVAKGVSVSLERSLESSELSEPTTVSGNFGLNDHLLLQCLYVTEIERNIIGGRYAFNEKMAVMFEHQWQDEDRSNKYGFGYQFNFKEWLNLVGLVEYQSKNITLTGQAEYEFTEEITAYGGIEYAMPDKGDAAINLLLGAEYKPLDIFSLYFDYLVPEEGDGEVYFGLEYWF